MKDGHALPPSKYPHFLTAVFVLCLFLCGPVMAAAQSTERARGIELFKQNDTAGAIEALSLAVKQDPSDAEGWYFLGLARNRQKDIKGARKAFETAIKARYQFGPAHTAYAYSLLLAGRIADAGREAKIALELNANDAEAHYILGAVHLRQGNAALAVREAETAVQLKRVFPAAYLLKSQALVAEYADRIELDTKNRNPKRVYSLEERQQNSLKRAELFKQAADALETYINGIPREQGDSWREQLATLRVYSKIGERAFSGQEVDTKVRVLKKPAPDYTAAAQDAGVAGTVILRAVFSAQGTVEHILVLSYLPHGLTEASVAAARRIKFVPATRDGKPVSMFMQLEYNFGFGP
jgi:tetratricopeptide (TPR) repeat protein